jgi:hypothetical protein
MLWSFTSCMTLLALTAGCMGSTPLLTIVMMMVGDDGDDDGGEHQSAKIGFATHLLGWSRKCPVGLWEMRVHPASCIARHAAR